jgi:hypothetical protein
MNAARLSRPRENQTMADSNPFAVNVPSALEALTVGDQSYKAGRDFVQQRQQEQLRQRVAQDILNGGDTRAGIARLIGGGDIAGATALGHFGRADTTNAIREYALSRAQGFPGTFIDWRNAVSRSGAAQGDGAAQGGGAPNIAIPGARLAPDGNTYVPDPNRPGKYLRVQP